MDALQIALVAPVGLQGAAMLVDELHFHRRRGLPRWERIGHPLDTLTVVACFAVTVGVPFSTGALGMYVALAAFSCLFITKDEIVHAARCAAGEQWLHAVLFVLHPIVLAAAALLWYRGAHALLVGQTAVTVAFGVYQLVFWNVPWKSRPAPTP
jgi:small-conductance mechanosensitive channel